MAIQFVSMGILLDSVNTDTQQGLDNRVPRPLRLRWAMQIIDGPVDLKAFLNAALNQELLAVVDADMAGTVQSVSAFANWHSTGGMHTSGAVVVQARIAGTDHDWVFTENNKTSKVLAVANYWE